MIEMPRTRRSSTSSGSLLRRGKILSPVHPHTASRIDDIHDRRFAEIGIHDVCAVLGARKPAVDHLAGARGSGRDVLADGTPVISGARDALARRAPVATDVLEITVRRH